MAMIDLHTHILPGVDDGASTLEESVELARALVDQGVLLAAATPHVRDDFPTDADTMEQLLAALRLALAREGIDLRLRGGGEIALDRLHRLSADDLRRFGLGGNPRYLLVEFPYAGWPLALPEVVSRLRGQKITPVLAHPERNPAVQEDPGRLRPLVAEGALVQLTASSVEGRLGRRAQETSLALLRMDLAHMIASDAHRAGIRASGLGAAARAVGDVHLADWLTYGVPHAIVTGVPVPARPRTRERLRR
ncbi:MAG: hypothetical protein C4306_07880 [Thermoleophilia bacterium]